MTGTAETINQIVQRQRNWQNLLLAGAPRQTVTDAAADHMQEIADFGPNPGNLRMLVHAPPNCGSGPALVVALHGCTQTAAGYDAGAGWTQLADHLGFVVLLPEQKCENNPNLCFNWFVEADTTRNHGEVASIWQMIEHLRHTHDIDPARIFITGLSAGGAMANAMLATYPETFAAGAIVAGLPYGTATTLREALHSMADGRQLEASEWGARVRQASTHQGPWPRVSIWHGDADTIVHPANAQALAAQWRNVHALQGQPVASDAVTGATHTAWGAEGAALVECWLVADLAHAIALAGEDPQSMIGKAGPLAHDVGIASTLHMAEFFGLDMQQEVDGSQPIVPAGTLHVPLAHPPGLGGILRAAEQMVRTLFWGHS